MPVNLEYSDCPDCGEPIDDDKEAGDECECGFVFPETREETEPSEDDITTGDHRTFYQSGKKIVEVSQKQYDKDTESGLRAVVQWMKRNNWFPAVWFVSDHGNAHSINMTEHCK